MELLVAPNDWNNCVFILNIKMDSKTKVSNVYIYRICSRKNVLVIILLPFVQLVNNLSLKPSRPNLLAFMSGK